MRKYLKALFFDIEYTGYAFGLISLFSIIGAFVIYFSPEAYNLISSKPLFEWLYLNQRFDTLWLYIITVLFGFTALTGFICLVKDVLNFRVFQAIFHITFLLVLLAHLITAMYGFRITEVVLPQAKPETVVTPPPFKPLKIFFRDATYQQNAYGVPTEIKANLIYLEGYKEKEGVLSINNPLKISDFHVVLKDLGNYLAAVNIRISDGKSDEMLPLTVGKTFTKDNFSIDFLAHDPQFSQIKVSYQDGTRKEVLFLSVGSKLTLSNKTYTILGFMPIIVPAIIVDVTYDPSLMLIFYASTLFTLFITIDLTRRLIKFFKMRSSHSQETS